LADTDPTQPGGQEEEFVSTPKNLRVGIEDAIAAKVHEAEKPDTEQLDVDENGDLQYQRDEKGRFAPKDEDKTAAEVDATHDAVVASGAPAPVEAPAPVAAADWRSLKEKIKVYGQEEEHTLADLVEDGKKYRQKDRAADIKLQNAARLERQIQEYYSKLQSQSPQGTDQPAQEARPDSATNSLTDIAALKQTVTAEVMAELEVRRQVDQFKQEYPEIADDPDLWAAAGRLEQIRIDTAAALGEGLSNSTLLQAYRKHGDELRKKFRLNVPAAVATEEKIERKRTIVAVPSASAKAPAPAEEKEPTLREVIAQEAAARKAGRQLPYQRSR